MKPLVLVVEDEPTLRASVVRGLSRAVHAEFVGVGTVREAKRALEERTPALMITDIDLPDGTGLEVAAELDARSIHVPIVFVSSYVRRYADRLPRRAGVETYEKPVPLEKLRRIVEDALSQPEPPSPFNAADYIQLAGMGRKSVLIDVRARSGNAGQVVVRDGEVIAARDARGTGMDAFKRLAFAEGRVTCRSLTPADASEQNIHGGCEELLMEAARLVDEEAVSTSGEYAFARPRNSVRPSLPPASSRSVQPPARLEFEDAYRLGVEALLERRYEEAFRLFDRARGLRQDDSRVNANLERLRSMGFGT